MLFSNQSTNQMHQLLKEGKEYLNLQKRYLGLQSAEMLTQLLSAILLWAVIILVGTLVLLFASFALAHWIGELTGSTVLGFGCMAIVLMAVIGLVYVRRKAWIVAPVAHFVVHLTAPPAEHETYAFSPELTTAERVKVGSELAERRTQMRQSAQALLEPTTKAANKWESATNILHNGMAIFRGVQMGMSAIAAVRLMLRGNKRRKR